MLERGGERGREGRREERGERERRERRKGFLKLILERGRIKGEGEKD